MFSLSSTSNEHYKKAAQLFITMIVVLILGKLITYVPVMNQLKLVDKFRAADITWFIAQFGALTVFYYCAKSFKEALPNNAEGHAFLKGIILPVAILIILIIGQALFWQLLEPFVSKLEKNIYFSLAILAMLAITVWLIFSIYRNSVVIVNLACRGMAFFSRFIPSKVITCQSCNAIIDADVSFCNQCGNKVKEILSCKECGAKLSKNQKFCQDCGLETSN